MSLIISALEKLDMAVSSLDSSVDNVELALQDYVHVEDMHDQVEAVRREASFTDSSGNVVGVDFVAHRLDKAIETVEGLLQEKA